MREEPSKQSRRLARWLRLLRIRSLLDRIPANAFGVWIVRWAIRFLARLAGRTPGVDVSPADAGDGEEAVPGEWVRAPGATDQTVILYLHGSGYVLCSPKTHRGMVGRLSKLTGMAAFVPDYRLAPEHPFPAASDDVVTAYRWLLEQGYAGDRIVVAGDSAGGHLAIGLAVASCREHGLEPPAGLLLISPLVDHSFELSAPRDRESRDPLFSAETARRLVALHTGAADPQDPRLALLECEASGLPPMLVQAGELELLSADAERFAALVNDAGGNCELQVWPGQIHVFQILLRALPEAHEALGEAARFVRSVTGAGDVAPARVASVR